MTPGVYIGVADVTGADGAPCEHVLVMHRMPDESRLALLVRNGVEVRTNLRQLARVVAAFHASAPTDQAITSCGSAEALAARWRSNTEGLRELGPMLVTKATLDEIEELALRYIAGREPLLSSRMRAGLVRDGHGDLLADASRNQPSSEARQEVMVGDRCWTDVRSGGCREPPPR